MPSLRDESLAGGKVYVQTKSQTTHPYASLLFFKQEIKETFPSLLLGWKGLKYCRKVEIERGF